MKAEISALLDDELDAFSTHRALDVLRRDVALRKTWQIYHVIGDALRHAPDISAEFSATLATRLAQEPVVLAPSAMAPAKKSAMRYALPLAASVMGAAAVGWVAQSFNSPQVAQLAVARSILQQMPATAVSLRPIQNDALKEYLVAHQAYSPSGPMQSIAPYVRTVSEIHQGGRQ